MYEDIFESIRNAAQKRNPRESTINLYTIDFVVTPQMLRHTYITNLIYAGVDLKTVQYLAGHENSKVTMDIYAKVKYNKPWELAEMINKAFSGSGKESKTNSIAEQQVLY